MIKARAGNTIILGVDDENIRRLKKNKPIKVDGADIGAHGLTIVIFHFKDMADAKKKFEEMGLKLPPDKGDPKAN